MLATTSPLVIPVTDSLKVMVAVKAPFCSVDGPEMETVGRVISASTENCVAAVLPLPDPSVAASAATSSVTVPSADGVTVTV